MKEYDGAKCIRLVCEYCEMDEKIPLEIILEHIRTKWQPVCKHCGNGMISPNLRIRTPQSTSLE